MFGNFFGRLFGSEKALERTVDGVYNGLDKLIFTDEERSNAAAKERSEARAMIVDWMKNTQGQNLSRRIIALSIAFTWLSQFIFSQVVSMVSVFVDSGPGKDNLKEVIAILDNGGEKLSDPVMLILAFYFASPYMSSIAGAVVNNFKKKAEDKT